MKAEVVTLTENEFEELERNEVEFIALKRLRTSPLSEYTGTNKFIDTEDGFTL